jgi:hypothetical protein
VRAPPVELGRANVRYSAVQLSEIDTMFVALSVGRFAVLFDCDPLADADWPPIDDWLPMLDEDGLDEDEDDEDDWPSGLLELDGLVDDEPLDGLDGLAPIAPAPPAGAASTVPVTVTL